MSDTLYLCLETLSSYVPNKLDITILKNFKTFLCVLQTSFQ